MEVLCSVCAWLGLAWGTLSFPTTAPGEAANAVIAGGSAYATRGAEGVEIVRLSDGAARRMRLPQGESADDLAAADGLLFVLDARPPGVLSVYSLADPEAPALRQPPVAVDVGPFSGVSAAAGRVAVSGGTGRLSLREYTPEGRLGSEIASADLGRGQPDVRLAPNGRTAFVSTHVYGPHFSVTVAGIGSAPLRVEPRGSVALESYGFTPGGAKPASFPIQTALAGDLLLVAHASGLGMVDARDPDSPRLLRVLEVGVLPVGIDVADGIAALVGSAPDPRLVLVDVRDSELPRVVGEVSLPAESRPTGVAIFESRVVVAAGTAGVLLFDGDELMQNRQGVPTTASGGSKRDPRGSEWMTSERQRARSGSSTCRTHSSTPKCCAA